jgi:hypothetical protein
VETGLKHRRPGGKYDIHIGAGIVLLALLLLLPQVISTWIRDDYLRMSGPFQTSSDRFAVSAKIVVQSSDKLYAEVQVENKTDVVIDRVGLAARLDDSLEAVLSTPTAVPVLDFNVPWIAGNWSQLFRGLPLRQSLTPSDWPTDQHGEGYTSVWVMGASKSFSSEGYSEERLGQLLAAPIKVKLWYAGGVEYLLVEPVVER